MILWFHVILFSRSNIVTVEIIIPNRKTCLKYQSVENRKKSQDEDDKIQEEIHILGITTI